MANERLLLFYAHDMLYTQRDYLQLTITTSCVHFTDPFAHGTKKTKSDLTNDRQHAVAVVTKPVQKSVAHTENRIQLLAPDAGVAFVDVASCILGRAEPCEAVEVVQPCEERTEHSTRLSDMLLQLVPMVVLEREYCKRKANVKGPSFEVKAVEVAEVSLHGWNSANS